MPRGGIWSAWSSWTVSDRTCDGGKSEGIGSVTIHSLCTEVRSALAIVSKLKTAILKAAPVSYPLSFSVEY